MIRNFFYTIVIDELLNNIIVSAVNYILIYPVL